MTNSPTAPAHFVGLVEIFTRKLMLPRLNDALRLADQILHFARDFDVLKDLHVRGSGGAVPRLTAREAVDQCGNNVRSRSFANALRWRST
jgi:hypothetical protein